MQLFFYLEHFQQAIQSEILSENSTQTRETISRTVCEVKLHQSQLLSFRKSAPKEKSIKLNVNSRYGYLVMWSKWRRQHNLFSCNIQSLQLNIPIIYLNGHLVHIHITFGFFQQEKTLQIYELLHHEMLMRFSLNSDYG